MLQLALNNIIAGALACDKQDAIRQVNSALIKAGNVSSGYLDSMLARENQMSTYLGNGVAIPHGTIDARSLVLKTGVQIIHFPKGINWGEDQIVYMVIGIAAKSDEHLLLLKKLTLILNDENLIEKLKTTHTVETLRNIFISEKFSTNKFKFDSSLISTEINAKNLITLQAINAGLLQETGAIDSSFISYIIKNKPLHLGQGIWINDSPDGNLISAIAISRSTSPFNCNGEIVSLLITVSMVDDQPVGILNNLSNLLEKKKALQLWSGNADDIIRKLNSPLSCDSVKEQVIIEEFVIRNEHGLHARPGAILVNIIKQFNCEVSVINLDGNGKPANGRSLMKLVSLGAKKGHHLRFISKGTESQQLINAIGEAISSGLGEIPT
ncbi:fused PTS fructose transporter subunit IIA/HPr protein [Candidatus Erwinia haradaeae]|uniref:Multiphosphoryl transfer protein n=1 Tax=Candidatus Erwinia haradaeae TaxID=1922217 RepID=A0A451D886_9GAMM|nr:fused PTS fructose transporter subunit IIA/HPr protein [Candidatus Erwinia haradaeae]VFP82028.1 Multiphosphoryl transfer protein [Candidatus Erwinia haradaeae]